MSGRSDPVTLHAVSDADLDRFFVQQQDPVARRMAAFVVADPADRAAFDRKWQQIRSDPSITVRTVRVGDAVAGHVASFVREGQLEVTYWIDRPLWGRGVATRALAALLALVPARPVHASAAKDNLASIRVLQKCGFLHVGEQRGFAPARGTEIDEVFLVLDAGPPGAQESAVTDHALRYPLGEFAPALPITDADVAGWIDEIQALPAALRAVVSALGDEQLALRYRPGGWTVAQVVHHLADSHLNSTTRFRLALTEERPTIRPYDERAWAELPDARSPQIAVSLDLLAALHARWVHLLRSMRPEQFDREFDHPESGRIALRRSVGLYAWHGRHHLAQIRQALTRGAA